MRFEQNGPEKAPKAKRKESQHQYRPRAESKLSQAPASYVFKDLYGNQQIMSAQHVQMYQFSEGQVYVQIYNRNYEVDRMRNTLERNCFLIKREVS